MASLCTWKLPQFLNWKLLINLSEYLCKENVINPVRAYRKLIVKWMIGSWSTTIVCSKMQFSKVFLLYMEKCYLINHWMSIFSYYVNTIQIASDVSICLLNKIVIVWISLVVYLYIIDIVLLLYIKSLRQLLIYCFGVFQIRIVNIIPKIITYFLSLHHWRLCSCVRLSML